MLIVILIEPDLRELGRCLCNFDVCSGWRFGRYLLSFRFRPFLGKNCCTCSIQLLRQECKASVPRHKTSEKHLFLVLEYESNRVGKYQYSWFLFDYLDGIITHLNLGAPAKHCLLVERRVEVHIFVRYVEHALQKQSEVSSTCIILKNYLIFFECLELFLDKFTSGWGYRCNRAPLLPLNLQVLVVIYEVILARLLHVLQYWLRSVNDLLLIEID